MAKKGKSSASKRNKKPVNSGKNTARKTTSRSSTPKVEASTKASATQLTSVPKAKSKSDPVNAPSFGQELPFTRMNYILMGIGVAVIGLGFILMSQDSFVDAKEFSLSLYVAPLVVMAGFIEIIYAIMYREKATPSTGSGE